MYTPNIKCSGQMAIALIITFGFFAVLYMILWHPIPAENRDLVNIMIGFLGGTGFGSIVSYYFGSSIGSRGKEDTISDAMKTLTPTDVPPPAPAPAPPVPDAPKPA